LLGKRGVTSDNEDTKLVNFPTSAQSVVTSSRSLWTSCLSWSILLCLRECLHMWVQFGWRHQTTLLMERPFI